ncbi:MAG: sensor histidine kinase [Oscillospiraceae bacterium]
MMVFKDGLSEHEIRLDGQAHMALSVQSQKTDWVLMTAIPETLYSSGRNGGIQIHFDRAGSGAYPDDCGYSVFATRISRPIETLADTMEHMNLRKLEHRVAVVGNDEIARLSISFNTLMDNLSTSIQNEYEMELLQKRSEIRVLQAQMNPHFLYNVLQSISSLAMLDKVSEIITVSNSLGNTLRYCINSSQPLAPLRDEIAHVTNYLTIQTIRFGDRLRYELSIPAPIPVTICFRE